MSLTATEKKQLQDYLDELDKEWDRLDNLGQSTQHITDRMADIRKKLKEEGTTAMTATIAEVASKQIVKKRKKVLSRTGALVDVSGRPNPAEASAAEAITKGAPALSGFTLKTFRISDAPNMWRLKFVNSHGHAYMFGRDADTRDYWAEKLPSATSTSGVRLASNRDLVSLAKIVQRKLGSETAASTKDLYKMEVASNGELVEVAAFVETALPKDFTKMTKAAQAAYMKNHPLAKKAQEHKENYSYHKMIARKAVGDHKTKINSKAAKSKKAYHATMNKLHNHLADRHGDAADKSSGNKSLALHHMAKLSAHRIAANKHLK